MSTQNVIRINGKAFDASSTIIRIAGFRLMWAKSIKYGQKRTRAKVPGFNRSQASIGYTSGTYEAEDAVIAIYRNDARELRDFLAKRAKSPSYGDARFPIIVQYSEPGLKEVKDELLGCSMVGDGGGAEAGTADASIEDATFQVTRMKRNGKVLHAFDPLLTLV
jgi:hypothetical protein